MYISKYYKKLFGEPEHNYVSLDENENGAIPQLSSDENKILSTPFTQKEVFDTIAQIKQNKASGLDRFPAEFYKSVAIL